MRPNRKKLALNKDSLRNLTNTELTGVAGAATVKTIQTCGVTACLGSCYYTCPYPTVFCGGGN